MDASIAGQFTTVSRYRSLSAGSTNLIADTAFGYDGMGRLTDLTHTQDATTYADYGMTYDMASRITQLSFTSLVGANGTSAYSYDFTNQLTAADHTGTGMPADESLSFDLNGNRTMTGYTTGTNNRLTSDGTWNYETDDEGNRTAQERISTAQANDKRIEFTWDHRNRLTKILYKNNAGTVTKEINYTYDLFDRRIEKSIDLDGAGSGSATVAHYIYDGESIILAFNAADKLTNRYLHGPVVDQIFADVSSDGKAAGRNQRLPCPKRCQGCRAGLLYHCFRQLFKKGQWRLSRCGYEEHPLPRLTP